MPRCDSDSQMDVVHWLWGRLVPKGMDFHVALPLDDAVTS